MFSLIPNKQAISTTVKLMALGFVLTGCGGNTLPPQPGKSTPDKVKFSSTSVNSHLLTVQYLTIAPGNCILVTLPFGKHLLIDGAPPGAEQDILSALQQIKITKLDYVIVTSPKADHIGCVPTLIGGVPCQTLISSGAKSPVMNSLEQAVKVGGGKTQVVSAGDKIKLDDEVTFEALAPTKVETAPAHPKDDWYADHTLVFRLNYKNVKVLFTGEISPDEHVALMRNTPDLRSSIVSGLNHGDKRIADIEFINKIAPYIVVLCNVPHNSHGYPNSEALDNLKTALTNVYRTDLQGEINLQINDKGNASINAATPATEGEMGRSGSNMKRDPAVDGGVDMSNQLEHHEILDRQGG